MKRIFASVALVSALALAAVPAVAKAPSTAIHPAGSGVSYCAASGALFAMGAMTLDPAVMAMGLFAGAVYC